MRAEVVSNVGLVRKNNEDAVFCDPERQFFIVADGMGGHVAGEIASNMAVETVVQVVSAQMSGGEPREVLREAFYQANSQIYEAAQKDPQYNGMGTTLTVSWVVQGRLYLAHVGDSRAYLIRDGVITSLTEDHSLVGELMREGGLTEEQAMTHPQKNILTRALGCSYLVEVDISDEGWQKGDRLLLCTDGMSNMVSSDDMAAVVKSTEDLKEAVNLLLNLALERGGYDNISAILVADK